MSFALMRNTFNDIALFAAGLMAFGVLVVWGMGWF